MIFGIATSRYPYLHLHIPVMEITLQFLNGVTPFRRCGLTHCVLIAEESDLVYCLLFTAGFQPFHRNKILGLIRVIRIPLIEIVVLKHVHSQLFTVFGVDGEAAGRLNGALYNPYPDVTGRRDFCPNSVTRMELL